MSSVQSEWRKKRFYIARFFAIFLFPSGLFNACFAWSVQSRRMGWSMGFGKTDTEIGPNLFDCSEIQVEKVVASKLPLFGCEIGSAFERALKLLSFFGNMMRLDIRIGFHRHVEFHTLNSRIANSMHSARIHSV